MLGAGVLLYTSLAVLFSMIPIPIILLRSLCISMMHIFMFGFIFLDDISLGVPYIHFSGRLYVCSYVSWFACFHCWYSSHVWLLYLVVQMIILCDVCFGDGLVIYFNYFCLWNEMFILYRIKNYWCACARGGVSIDGCVNL